MGRARVWLTPDHIVEAAVRDSAARRPASRAVVVEPLWCQLSNRDAHIHGGPR